MDRIRIITERLFLTDEAAHAKTTVTSYSRRVVVQGKQAPASLILTLALGLYAFLRIICHRLDSGRWRVACIDANLPAHLYGHNSRPIRTTAELALALTRLKHFVSLVVRPECHHRIIPGVGTSNRGFVRYIEAMIQIQDPGHRFLIGSHVAAMRYQHSPALVSWSETTIFKGREIGLSFYDKLAQRSSGILDPKGVPCTRIECIVKNDQRVAKEVRATGVFSGEPGQVVRTLSLESAYAVLRQNLGRMSGLGSIIGELPLNLSTTSKYLLMGLASHIDKPHAVDLLLENYRRSQEPCDRTFRTVNAEVREHAHHFIAPDALALVPADFAELQWSDVQMPGTEKDFNILCRDLGAPSVPCPHILDAWSQTTFLKSKPVGSDLSGPHAPAPYAPWRETL